MLYVLQLQGLWFDPELWLQSGEAYACLLLQVLWFPPTVQKLADSWIGYSKLPLGVCVCVHSAI